MKAKTSKTKSRKVTLFEFLCLPSPSEEFLRQIRRKNTNKNTYKRSGEIKHTHISTSVDFINTKSNEIKEDILDPQLAQQQIIDESDSKKGSNDNGMNGSELVARNITSRDRIPSLMGSNDFIDNATSVALSLPAHSVELRTPLEDSENSMYIENNSENYSMKRTSNNTYYSNPHSSAKIPSIITTQASNPDYDNLNMDINLNANLYIQNSSTQDRQRSYQNNNNNMVEAPSIQPLKASFINQEIRTASYMPRYQPSNLSQSPIGSMKMWSQERSGNHSPMSTNDDSLILAELPYPQTEGLNIAPQSNTPSFGTRVRYQSANTTSPTELFGHSRVRLHSNQAPPSRLVTMAVRHPVILDLKSGAGTLSRTGSTELFGKYELLPTRSSDLHHYD